MRCIAGRTEGFYDLQCPNCKASFPAIKQLAKRLEASGRLRITIHTFPLPYHRNAYLAAQAAHGLGDSADPKVATLVWKWFDAYFDAQDDFANAATADASEAQVKTRLVALANRSGLPGDAVAASLDSRDADLALRVSWKYACSRAVFGTPTYMVNGVPIAEESAGWGVRDWLRFLDRLGGHHGGDSSHSTFAEVPEQPLLIS